jgi:Domain of unknown function (DUF4388)
VYEDLNSEVRTALFDVERYLLDEIPPLTAVDAVESLMTQPPELLMRQIHSWAVDQGRMQSASQSDFLFHALRKVHMLGTLKLIERSALDAYFERVVSLAMQACPPGERELLQTNLVAMRNSLSLSSGTSVVNISRDGGKGAQGGVKSAVSDAVSRTARRLSMVVDRLTRTLPLGRAPEPDTPAQLVSMAAASSTSEEELKGYLSTLAAHTGGAEPDKLFHVLATDVPDWDIALPESAKQPASLEAMHKIITLTPTPLESARRLRELMTEAVQLFNNGALAASVSMLELAARVVVEKKLDGVSVERIRADAVDTISSERLKKYTENKSKHPLLRRALGFFPTLTKQSLFQQLRGEQRPERRRSLLGLLEAYGAEARLTALVELEHECNRPAAEIDTYYLRNIIYLLHRIGRDSEESTEKELELLTRASARGQNIYVIKEAVIPIGHLKGEAPVKLLTTRLAEFEVMLVRKDVSLYPMEEMQKVLDRITTALARIATPAALLNIARHGMKPNPLLGDTRARLAALSQHDLSFDEQTVDILVKAIRDDLPAKILGRVINTRPTAPLRLIEALSSTRSEKVETLLSELAEKFADHDIGRAAAAALYNLSSAGKQATPRAAAAATLTGDLDFFGLPSLMQSLADQQATGIVTLSARQSGQTAGKMLFLQGKFLDAQNGHLRGVDAVYQLLERPVTGTFAFVPHPTPAAAPKSEPLDVMGLLFEGIRRHDELKQLALFVPDDLTLKASGKPTPDPEENDPTMIRDVWVKATGGTRVGDWERQVTADAWRVRRLVARWIEEGALQPV